MRVGRHRRRPLTAPESPGPGPQPDDRRSRLSPAGST